MLEETETARPSEFTMAIQGGMLEALGINMYTTLGKCLVEFVANAYDGESASVDITVPVDEIQKARGIVREAAKADGNKGKSNVLLLALPPEIKVTIRDSGHGMTPEQVENNFLPINRKRRLDQNGQESNLKTEGGKRHVMGRKGLGKLAGFGAAENVTIQTKRSGQTFATTFTMNFADLCSKSDITKATLPATYIDDLPIAESFTQVELSGLKCDAVRNNVESIKETIAEAFFGILPEEFCIRFNGDVLTAKPVEYEFLYPSKRDDDDFATMSIGVELMDPLEFKYVVKFRKMGAHLPAAKRGARIYCNGRLAGGPSLLDLPTGMHNFHAQSYMECIVIADAIDRFGVDLINTNRTGLRQDSELVEKFLNTITTLMKAAIADHSKFRDAEAQKEIDHDPTALVLSRIAAHLPKRTRVATRKLMTSIAAQYGVTSNDFRTIVPLVLNAANATEVLIKLSELGAHPDTIENVAKQLRDLAEIEKSDSLKLFRARKNGIIALQKLESEGEDEWRKTGFENKLHALFKSDPWLIKPEYTRPFVSDEDLQKVTSKLAQHLGIDKFSPPQVDGKTDERRPDLVFVMGDSPTPRVITVVELKSPSLPLEYIHLEQLRSYMFKIDEFLKTEFKGGRFSIVGYLIGAMPATDTKAEGCRRLLVEIEKRGASEDWDVVGIRDLIERARATHLAAIDALEHDLAEDDAFATDDTASALADETSQVTAAIVVDTGSATATDGVGEGSTYQPPYSVKQA